MEGHEKLKGGSSLSVKALQECPQPLGGGLWLQGTLGKVYTVTQRKELSDAE